MTQKKSQQTPKVSKLSIGRSHHEEEEGEQDSALKVFQRQQQMALLGMDASTFSMVPKTRSTTTSFVPVSQKELDNLKRILEEQVEDSRNGKFSNQQQIEVGKPKLTKLMRTRLKTSPLQSYRK